MISMENRERERERGRVKDRERGGREQKERENIVDEVIVRSQKMKTRLG